MGQILEVSLLPDPVIIILFSNPAMTPNAEKVLKKVIISSLFNEAKKADSVMTISIR